MLPTVSEMLAGYQRAIAEPNAVAGIRMESAGSIVGAGLSGVFHTWADGERQRDDQNLGARSETTLRIGDRVWYGNADGNVREFTGVLLRRARTEHFIDSGAFATMPERCAFRGRFSIAGRPVYALDVKPQGGETETVYLDASTWLPARVAYDDDDGRTTIDLTEWRTVSGHRFPFKALVSDGNREFDTVQTTEWVTLDRPISPAVFVPLVPRTIEMRGPETIALTMREGHLFAPVTIAGRPYTFLVDSGAQNILIDTHVAREVGLNAQGALEASGARRTGGLQIAGLDALRIGSGRMRDLVVTTLDLGRSTSGAFRIDGILGYPFFAEATVKIDSSRLTMTFGPPGTMRSSGSRIVLETDRAFPEARLQINRSLTMPFIIDTGNASELLLYRPFIDAHPGFVPLTLSNRRSYGIGGSTQSYRTTLDEIDLAEFAIYHSETDVMQATSGAFADRFDAGNVGLGLLKNFIVTFDLSANALYLERGPAFDDGRNRR